MPANPRLLVLVLAGGCALPPESSEFSPATATQSEPVVSSTASTGLDWDRAVDLLQPPASIGAESRWCWFVEPNRTALDLWVVGMDSGTFQDVATFTPTGGVGVGEGFMTPGMAYAGDSLVVNGDDSNTEAWFQLDLASGTLTNAGHNGLAGEGATAIGAEIVYAQANEVMFFDDFSSLMAIDPAFTVIAPPDIRARVPAAADGVLYAAYSSTDHVQEFDAATLAKLGDIQLAHDPDMVWGLSVAAGTLDVLFQSGGNARIASFDLGGALLGEIAIDHPTFAEPSGLWCDTP